VREREGSEREGERERERERERTPDKSANRGRKRVSKDSERRVLERRRRESAENPR
jgi:hypothetical protein